MGNWITTQPVDFTPDGDTTSSAIKKHDVDIANIYELLHRVRRFDFGPNPPVDPVEGHLWAVDGGDGKPVFLRMYKNSKWHRLSFVTCIDPPSNPNEGCLLLEEADGNYKLSIYYNGSWREITSFAEAVSGKMVQANDRGTLQRSLFGYESIYAPSSDIDLNIGERFNYSGTGQTVNLHINANNGLYRITYSIYDNTNNYNFHKLLLNNTTYSDKFTLLFSENSENNGEKDSFYDSGIDSLRLGYGKLCIFTGLINTKQPNVGVALRGHVDNGSRGMDDAIVSSFLKDTNLNISKLGTVDFRGTCTYRITVERLL